MYMGRLYWRVNAHIEGYIAILDGIFWLYWRVHCYIGGYIYYMNFLAGLSVYLINAFVIHFILEITWLWFGIQPSACTISTTIGRLFSLTKKAVLVRKWPRLFSNRSTYWGNVININITVCLIVTTTLKTWRYCS